MQRGRKEKMYFDTVLQKKRKRKKGRFPISRSVLFSIKSERRCRNLKKKLSRAGGKKEAAKISCRQSCHQKVVLQYFSSFFLESPNKNFWRTTTAYLFFYFRGGRAAKTCFFSPPWNQMTLYVGDGRSVGSSNVFSIMGLSIGPFPLGRQRRFKQNWITMLFPTLFSGWKQSRFYFFRKVRVRQSRFENLFPFIRLSLCGKASLVPYPIPQAINSEEI